MMSVRIAELKSRLSENLRLVRRGNVLTVLDRQTPVARIIPVEGAAGPLAIRRPPPGTGSIGGVRLPAPPALSSDVLALLLREREVDR